MIISQHNIIHLSGLNGLRALAALSVVLSHTMQDTFGDWGVKAVKLPFFVDGVTLFFVISGFLITYLLLKEEQKTDNIKIGSFYMRRILRIWPIYYLYIGLSFLVLLLFGLQTDIGNHTIWYYLFFAANIPFISASGIWVLVHFWSIGVEEQFYLFWPWLVKFAKKYLLTVACIVCALWLFAKMSSWVLCGNKAWIYKFFNVTRFHCMMLGAIGAILYDRKQLWYIRLFTNKFAQIMAWALFLLSGFYSDYIPSVVQCEFYAIVSLFLIMGQVNGGIFINLENQICDFAGKISYGIYVWHPLIIYLLSKIYVLLNGGGQPLNYVLIYGITVTATIIVAWLSYQFYEKPFLHLKSRFAIVKSQNSITR